MGPSSSLKQALVARVKKLKKCGEVNNKYKSSSPHPHVLTFLRKPVSIASIDLNKHVIPCAPPPTSLSSVDKQPSPTKVSNHKKVSFLQLVVGNKGEGWGTSYYDFRSRTFVFNKNNFCSYSLRRIPALDRFEPFAVDTTGLVQQANDGKTVDYIKWYCNNIPLFTYEQDPSIHRHCIFVAFQNKWTGKWTRTEDFFRTFLLQYDSSLLESRETTLTLYDLQSIYASVVADIIPSSHKRADVGGWGQ